MGVVRRLVDGNHVLSAIIEDGRLGDEFICSPGAVSPCTPATFFGCPDTSKPCNAVTVIIKADDSFRVSFSGSPSLQGCTPGNLEGGCIFDEDLEERHRAWSWMLALMPSFPLSGAVANADGERTFTVYWQGQHVTWWDNPDGSTNRTWSLYPDQDYAGSMDYFIFRPGAWNDKLNLTFSIGTYLDCDSDGTPGAVAPATCFVQFQGEPASPLLARWDEITTQVANSGRGRNRTTVLQITPSILWKDINGHNLEASDFGFITRYMITYPADPTGSESRRKSMVISSVDIVATNSNPDGCYELRFLDEYPTDIDLLESAWDSSLGGAFNTARETVYIYDDGSGGFAHHVGGTCASPSAT